MGVKQITIKNKKRKRKIMNITQEPKHTVSTPTRPNRATSKKQISISLMAALLALLSSASPGMAWAKGKPVRAPAPVDLGSGQAPVALGWAGSFAILSKSGITDVPASAITGDVGTSPITGAAITGLDCAEVTGTIYTVDAAGPACRVEYPALLAAAVSDMETAYTDAAGRTSPDATELGAGNIDGMTVAPGLYKWGTGVLIPTGVTLDAQGDTNAVWIFQIAGVLSVGNGAVVTLSGGAQAKNIYWQVTQATLGTTSDVKGIILSSTSITMNTGATLDGRALAQTAVTLQMNAVTEPN
jgi:hypothetical protein